MKSQLYLLATTLLTLLLFSSCLKEECTTYMEVIHSIPVIVQEDDFRVELEVLTDRTLENPGKIFFSHNLILINELYEGIHVIDNSDPHNPQFFNFISIPGNVDMYLRGNYLYADSYVDLLTIDISNWNNPQLVSRENDVFTLHGWSDEGLIAKYDFESEWVEVDCNNQGRGSFDFSFPVGESSSFGNQGQNQGQGIAGSMARFGYSSGHLYALDTRHLKVFGLNSPAQPVLLNEIPNNAGIETIFPYKDYLFVGANQGMFIYDNSNPSNPTYLSAFLHANACDPVFVKDDRAYVTLRDGTLCQGADNQLDVIDISNISNPSLIKSYPMTNPHGLSIVDDLLFLCDGRDGLKIFDISDDLSIDKNRLSRTNTGNAFDVIAISSDHIIVTGDKGLWQFDTSNPKKPSQISFLRTK
ncbi:MAG: hypothetical protein EA362_00550 [Saprospirales bacterium]|nr:MAG: hypothetical protein EA362_00550 [Saprospirales bacterium]